MAVLGEDRLAVALADAARDAGFSVGSGDEAWLTIDCRPAGAQRTPAGAPVARLLREGSLHRLNPRAAGFHSLPPFDAVKLVELTRTALTDPEAATRTEAFFTALGRHIANVDDAPGLVCGRVICQLINEAAFLLGEGNGTPEDIDAGMELGVNHPRGPVAWAEAIGLDAVIGTLDALHAELGEERYRVAPFLRKRAAVGAGLR